MTEDYVTLRVSCLFACSKPTGDLETKEKREDSRTEVGPQQKVYLVWSRTSWFWTDTGTSSLSIRLKREGTKFFYHPLETNQ